MSFLIILGTAILQIIISAIWFSPLMFGKFWMKVNGIHSNATKEELKEMNKKAIPYYGIQFILTLVMDYILFGLVRGLGIKSIMSALLLWLGFMVPVYIQSELWTKSSNNMKIKKTLVVCGQLLIVTLLAGIIFGVKF